MSYQSLSNEQITENADPNTHSETVPTESYFSEAAPKKSKRGFASMSPEKRKEIAGKGGKAANARGTAYKFDSEKAREAGRKGGKSVSENREHMAEIGRRGGESSSRAKGYKVLQYRPLDK